MTGREKLNDQAYWALPVLSTALQTMQQGSLTLSYQDGKIVHVERSELFRPNKAGTTAVREPAEALRLAERLLNEGSGLKYGQMNVKVTEGRVVQVEKTEKRRVNDQTGLYGDGI